MERINLYLNKNILLKNSLFLITSNGLLSLGGFVFWIFIARLYSTDQIGIATSLIGIVNLISSLALLGFNTGMMRFLPTSENKNVLINSILSLVAFTSFFLGLIMLVTIGFISPVLGFIRENIFVSLFFILFIISSSLNLLLEAVLIAFRSTQYVLLKNIVQAVIKLCLPFLFISLGSYGIFSSFYIGGVIALFLGGMLLFKTHRVIYGVKISRTEVKRIGIVSIGTYISGLMSMAPLYILPILITNVLGPAQTAFYYIVATTISVLNLIPLVIAQNLMVEGSYNISQIEIHLKKASQIIFALLIPSIILILLFGNYILLVFGKQYSIEGLTLLRILSVCSLLVGFNYLLSTLLITFNQVKLLILSNTIYAFMLFGSSYYFIHFGIVGIGYATILSQVLLILLYLIALVKIKKIFLLKALGKFS